MTSPCKASADTTVDSCELDKYYNVCNHCGRTARDIEEWQEMTQGEKKAANLAAKQRLKGVFNK